jgi:predicted phage replisome organizer
MAEIKWIKIATDIFDDEKIRVIENMPEGETILVIWLKLLTLAGKKNDQGFIYLTESIPYTPEILSDIWNRDSRIVSLALNTFSAFNMIEIESDIIRVLNWDKHQNVEGMEKIRDQTRRRVSNYRDRKQLTNCNVTVTLRNATEEDKNKNKIKNKINKESRQFALAMLIYDLHKKNVDENLNKTDKQIDSWASDIEKLNRIDGRSWEDIESVIHHVKSPGNFWNANIISGSKLREKFPQVFAQMKSSRANQKIDNFKGEVNFEF